VKITTSRDTLFSQLQIAARVASSHSAVQALSGTQIAASADGVEIRATDLEVGLRIPLQASIEHPGTTVLPARLLLDVVRALPAGSVTIEVRAAEQDVEIVSGSATFDMRTLRGEDFPELPDAEAGAVVTVPAGAFVETADVVGRSASRDETRPILTGVLVSAADTTLRMVATDSYRLGVKETTLEAPLDGSFEANVPARALQELSRLVAHGGDESVAVCVRDNQVVFRSGGATLSSRLIDGQFPNYRQLLPDAFEHELRLPVPDLLDVVRRISLMAQKNAPVRLGFTDGELTVSAKTPDVGEAREMLPAPFQGEPLEIGFNAEFLRDGLESVASEGDVILKLISPLRPGLIETAEGTGFLYLIMPIRLNA
jgi:DNA polymerase III subunit beta